MRWPILASRSALKFLAIGEANLPATMPYDASSLFSKNVLALLMLIAKGGTLKLDLEDEVIKGTLLTHAGEIIHPATKDAFSKL